MGKEIIESLELPLKHLNKFAETGKPTLATILAMNDIAKIRSEITFE